MADHGLARHAALHAQNPTRSGRPCHASLIAIAGLLLGSWGWAAPLIAQEAVAAPPTATGYAAVFGGLALVVGVFFTLLLAVIWRERRGRRRRNPLLQGLV